MSEKTLSNNPPVSTSLAAEAGRYRASMAGFLQKSLAAMNGILSTVDLDGIFCPIDQAKFDEDPMMPFRRMSYLLIAKARLHVFAALSANKSSNIHSLAVQMRPALECAGQVVSLFKDLFGKYPRAESTIRRHLDADYYQTVVRVSRGQIDHDELLKQISVANPMRKEPLRKIMRFRESEKVRDLEFGGNWYDYLSNCFYHSDLSALKDLSYYGGVRSCHTVRDEYAFAELMGYLAHQVMVMVMYAAVCPDDGLKEDKRSDKAVELLRKKKEISEGFRRKLMSIAGQRDSRTTSDGSVR